MSESIAARSIVDLGMCPKRRDDVNVRVIDAATVVLDRRANLIHQLNESATFIWGLCDAAHTPAEIAEQLSNAFDIDAQTAERDVMKAIRQLEEIGLLEGVLASNCVLASN